MKMHACINIWVIYNIYYLSRLEGVTYTYGKTGEIKSRPNFQSIGPVFHHHDVSRSNTWPCQICPSPTPQRTNQLQFSEGYFRHLRPCTSGSGVAVMWARRPAFLRHRCVQDNMSPHIKHALGPKHVDETYWKLDRPHSTQHSKLIVPPMSPLLSPCMPARRDVIVCEKLWRRNHPLHCWLKLLLTSKYAVFW